MKNIIIMIVLAIVAILTYLFLFPSVSSKISAQRCEVYSVEDEVTNDEGETIKRLTIIPSEKVCK